jgi:hypothetical protein
VLSLAKTVSRVNQKQQEAGPNPQGGIGFIPQTIGSGGTIMDKNMQIALGNSQQLEDLKKKKKKYQTIMDVLLGSAGGTPSTAMGV